MPRDAHSPSSIALGARCQRAWAYRYLANLREPDLSWAAIQAGAPCTNRQRSLALGKAIHATIERWYGHADPTDPAGEGAGEPGAPNWDWFPGQVAWGGTPWLPAPEACRVVRVEEPIALEAHGVRWAGRRDLIVLPEPDEARRIGLPLGWALIDHKSSSNPARYALTPERLRVDVQACTYALATIDDLGLPARPLPLRWIYYDTRPATGTRTAPRVARSRSLAVDAAVTRAEALAVLKEPAALARRLDVLTSVDEAPPNPEACADYGGCPFSAQQGGPCTARRSVAAAIDARFGAAKMALSREEIQARFAAAKPAADVAAPAEAPAPDPAPAEPRRRGRPPKPAEEPPPPPPEVEPPAEGEPRHPALAADRILELHDELSAASEAASDARAKLAEAAATAEAAEKLSNEADARLETILGEMRAALG